jgi:GxxExxY protein
VNAMDLNALSNEVIGAAIEVHRSLGPGLLESVYEVCLAHELTLRNVPFERQKEFSIGYKGVALDAGYRLDLLVEKRLILELKSCEAILPIHEAQLLTYLRLSGLHLGLIVNFNVPLLKDGIKRIVNNL